MIKQSFWGYMLCGCLLFDTSNPISATEKSQIPKIENDLFTFRLIPRTPEQMAAFYEGRGFPKSALKLVKQSCFITAGIRNKSKKTIWLKLASWRFYTTNNVIARLDRSYWNKNWDRIKLPQAHRSTFGWTLLPNTRDLQPNEPVGGNITLPQIPGKFTLEARFITGKNQRGDEIIARFENIQCAQD